RVISRPLRPGPGAWPRAMSVRAPPAAARGSLACALVRAAHVPEPGPGQAPGRGRSGQGVERFELLRHPLLQPVLRLEEGAEEATRALHPHPRRVTGDRRELARRLD